MMKLIGILLLINSAILTTWWVAKGNPFSKTVIFLFCVVGFFSIILILSDRAIEITVGSVGTIKAAAEQATADAKEISDIKERIAAQSATVDLVASQATKAKELSEELAKKNAELSELIEFNTVATEARNDNREAFDQLEVWSDDKTYPFRDLASRAWLTILNEHALPYHLSGFTIPWDEGFDPSTLDIVGLRKQYASCPRHLKLGFIEYVAKRNDIPKKERMQFFIDVMKDDQYLKAVEYAGRYFDKEAQLNLKPLAVEAFVKWWEESKDSIQ
jgi:hypothetical protein